MVKTDNKLTAQRFEHERLRRDVLEYIIDHDNEDPIELLKKFAERLRVVLGCDQVIYRDLKETRIMVNSPAIEKTWSVPFEYCLQCQHLDPHHPMYAGGYTEMENCQKGWNGIPVYEKCPIKSSLTRIVHCDGEVEGYLAIHYVQGYHAFTDLERATLEEFCLIISISLSRYRSHKSSFEAIEREKVLQAQKDQLRENLEVIGGLAGEYLALYYINIKNDGFKVYSVDGTRLADTKKLLTENADCFALLRKFAQSPAVHPDDRHLFLQFDKDSVVERLAHIKKFTVRFRRDYGQGYLWSEMDVVKYEKKDEPANAIVIGFAERDNAIRQEIEQQNQLQEALSMAQSANRAKTTFLNNMSHDIRTPMNAIIGYTGLALSHIDNKQQIRDYLGKIGQSSNHLLSLINEVLDMSRIESGKMNLDEKPENIHEIISTLQDIVQSDIRAKGIDFRVNTITVCDEHVVCDKLRLNQVLLNVLSNAIKYTPEGGAVELQVSEKNVKDNGYGTYVFRVKDNGMGMSSEFLKTIFDPFSRAKSTTVSGIQGTGLGMAITKNIIDMMGGTIDIKSEQDKGTAVTLTFDFKITEGHKPAETPDQNISDADFSGKKILLVEDNALNREIAQAILEEYGCKVICAEDGDIAVNLMKSARKGEYDLVLMDIQMPTMDGYEATRHIRALGNETSRIPIVAMTANAFEEDRKAALEAGMDEHIAKPIDMNHLRDVLARFLVKNCGIDR